MPSRIFSGYTSASRPPVGAQAPPAPPGRALALGRGHHRRSRPPAGHPDRL